MKWLCGTDEMFSRARFGPQAVVWRPFPKSLCDEQRLWWLGFLLYHRLLWLCFMEGYLPVCVF